jgi:serine phosphatase RsbU (regulator of sigma subunit)
MLNKLNTLLFVPLAHVRVENYRNYTINAVIAICGIVAHVAFLSLFLLFEVYTMAIVNLFSIAIFTYIFFQNRKRTLQILIILCNLEVAAHAIIATIFLGFESSFHFYLFLLFQGIFIQRTSKAVNIALGAFTIFGYLFMIWWVKDHAPMMTDLRFNGIVFFSYFNIVSAATIGVLVTIYFKSIADSAERILLNSNSVLDEQNKKIEKANEQISEQKELLENSIAATNENISYAQRIQQSVLPPHSRFQKLFGEHNFFTFYQPRDVVSGDFYYLDQKDNKTFLIVSDCTGHGVSGALMSMIGINSIQRILENKDFHAPEKLLGELHIEIKTMLNQNETNTNDGMDIAVVVINHEKNEIEFAGAGASIFIQNQTEIKQHKGTIVPVGGRQTVAIRTFEKETIQITEKTKIYFSSDGYLDQLGGSAYKRLASNQQFISLLGDFTETFENKNNRLVQHFSTWKGDFAQTDDVCLIGISLDTTSTLIKN